VEVAIEKNVWLMKELDSRVPGLAYIHMVRVASGIDGWLWIGGGKFQTCWPPQVVCPQ
jgi:hypothetical protein